MSFRRSGVLFSTNKGEYGVAYWDEQRKEFEGLCKSLVNMFEDIDLNRPILNDDLTQKKVLKSWNTLKCIGFID